MCRISFAVLVRGRLAPLGTRCTILAVRFCWAGSNTVLTHHCAQRLIALLLRVTKILSLSEGFQVQSRMLD